jgi:hypothetical protein
VVQVRLLVLILSAFDLPARSETEMSPPGSDFTRPLDNDGPVSEFARPLDHDGSRVVVSLLLKDSVPGGLYLDLNLDIVNALGVVSNVDSARVSFSGMGGEVVNVVLTRLSLLNSLWGSDESVQVSLGNVHLNRDFDLSIIIGIDGITDLLDELAYHIIYLHSTDSGSTDNGSTGTGTDYSGGTDYTGTDYTGTDYTGTGTDYSGTGTDYTGTGTGTGTGRTIKGSMILFSDFMFGRLAGEIPSLNRHVPELLGEMKHVKLTPSTPTSPHENLLTRHRHHNRAACAMLFGSKSSLKTNNEQ